LKSVLLKLFFKPIYILLRPTVGRGTFLCKKGAILGKKWPYFATIER
jgi:hypothetical protein